MATGSSSSMLGILYDEETHYLRAAHLVIHICPKAVRKLFDSHHPPSQLTGQLAAKQSMLLKCPGIYKTHWPLLFPSHGVVKSSDFDITLLMTLLRNFTGIPQPIMGWYTMPAASDHSPGADLVRVSLYRNQIVHSIKATIAANDFKILWVELENVIDRFSRGTMKQEVIDLRYAVLDETQKELLLTTLEHVKKLKLHEEEIKEIKRKFDEMKQTIPHYIRGNEEFIEVKFQGKDFPRYLYFQRQLKLTIDDVPIPPSEELARIQQDPVIVFAGDNHDDNINMLADGKGSQEKFLIKTHGHGYAESMEIIVYFLNTDEEDESVIKRLSQYGLKYEWLILVQHSRNINDTPLQRTHVISVNKNSSEIKAAVMSALETKIIRFLDKVLASTDSSNIKALLRAKSLHKSLQQCALPQILQQCSLQHPIMNSKPIIEEAKRLTDEYQSSDLDKNKIMQHIVTSHGLRIMVKDIETKKILDDIYKWKTFLGREPYIIVSDNIEEEPLCKEILHGAELEYLKYTEDEGKLFQNTYQGTLGGVAMYAQRQEKMYAITCHHCLDDDGFVKLKTRETIITLGKQRKDIHALKHHGDVAFVDVEDNVVDKIEQQFEKQLVSLDNLKTPVSATLFRGDETADMYNDFIDELVFKRGSVTGLREGILVGASDSSLKITDLEPFAEEGDSGSLVVIYRPDSINPVNMELQVLGVLRSRSKTEPGIYYATPLFPFLEDMKRKFPDKDFDIEFYPPKKKRMAKKLKNEKKT